MKYIALLRGINVSGQKLIKMEALRKALEQLPFTNVSTYIQSGNILFESEEQNIGALQQLISTSIKDNFNFDVATIVITPRCLQSIIENRPIDSTADPAQPYVAFLSDIPAQSDSLAFMNADFGGDTFLMQGRHMYIYYANSAGKTKLTNAVIEKKLKARSTARNWKTVKALFELAQQ
ncbi:MAG TPA: DUF1697 domain-containing protein [Flavobacterium sp.]|jgi:uncharacterized protein (DUF1697 family)